MNPSPPNSETSPARPALVLDGVTVQYDSVKALSDVSIAFAQGQIHAVVGQNGAGKTTFARVCSGLVKPTRGRVHIGAHEIRTGHVNAARAAGVELVHQSFALPASFTVAQAMEFGSDRHRGIFTSRQLEKRWQAHLDGLGLSVSPREVIRNLPIETQQGIEIARALVTDAKVLILDEPTAVLAPAGVETLFERIRILKKRGVTVVLILHKIREMMAIADTVSVLRRGAHVTGPVPCSSIGAAELSQWIMGDAKAPAPSSAPATSGASAASAASAASPRRDLTAPTVLQLKNLSTKPDAEGAALADVSLNIRAGEIIGIAGVEGNGQRTLVRAIAALAQTASGSIELAGRDVTHSDLATRRAAGLRIIPFERNVEGLSLNSSLWENWSMGRLLQGGLLAFVRPARLQAACDTALTQWDVRYAHSGQPAGSLSGGNAQKVIFAREVDASARLIIAAQPTRGLDIGATAYVWKALREARGRGAAIILISSDLDELFDISDRVLVMLRGQVVGDYGAPYDLREVGQAMVGAHA
ncbi:MULTISPECIES: ABC transporter ATP-binding protein [unclassified Variovorax]|uniref:ABC transporter ATP-binding protein n=1 Tax=unclassified Variovorax TaxID=663243 RepID=UPI0008CDF34E|nr:MULTISPECIES: ATP-binding cassette domain-containing protein [unclassified Variovorax]SEK14732.1 simple sugar transport system ATP-binding protein [Variovorax sp. OK202]SFE02989.1 simple sugar transport system ATP-binding protein [Variovorax sp. OK212]